LKKQKEKGKKSGSGAKKGDPQEAKEEPASTIENNKALEQEVNIGEEEQTISALEETQVQLPHSPQKQQKTSRCQLIIANLP